MQMISPETQVSNGLDWLDQNAPAEWWNRIDVQTLDVSDADFCVLGQVFQPEAETVGLTNGYAFASREFFRVQGEFWTDSDVLYRLGFLDITEDGELDFAWRGQILERRALVSA